MMTEEELINIPYLRLPKAVRERASKRFNEFYGEQDGRDIETNKLKLAQLSVFRLVMHFNGDAQAAINYASQAGRYPMELIGDCAEEWERIVEELGAELLNPSAGLIERGKRIRTLLLEEINKIGWTPKQ
jgi:hypothetical protein